MKKIEIDEEVYRELQKLAKPFEDTPNTVLRRILGLDKLEPEQKSTEELVRKEKSYEQSITEMMSSLGMREEPIPKATRVYGGIPAKEYRILILEALLEKGGKATVQEVYEIVEQRMGNEFKDIDLQVLSSGGIRWKKNVAWARYHLKQEGLLRSDSPHGVWEISEKGIEYLNKFKK
ncbi:MAG: winged helix-turn-helix domain-containing protein [Candidatus Aenigmatarchaeota archaeon]